MERVKGWLTRADILGLLLRRQPILTFSPRRGWGMGRWTRAGREWHATWRSRSLGVTLVAHLGVPPARSCLTKRRLRPDLLFAGYVDVTLGVAGELHGVRLADRATTMAVAETKLGDLRDRAVAAREVALRRPGSIETR